METEITSRLREFEITSQGPSKDETGYDYKLLDASDSIRLLVLKPLSDEEVVLQAEIIHVRLADDPHYEALSYVWGEPVFPHVLHLEDGTLNITEHLAAALRQLRLHNKPRTLWIDAICINQTDDEEKDQQVKIMSQIYKKSCRVLAWLGVGTENTDIALEYHEKLAKSAPDFGSHYVEDDCHWFGIPSLTADEKSIRDMVDQAALNKVHSLYGTRWFTRIWVVQEVSLGPQTTICCGTKELDWPIFGAVMLLLRGAYNTVSRLKIPNSIAFNHAESILTTRATYRQSKNPHLQNSSLYDEFGALAWKLRFQNCTKEHDRIYGILGLLPNHLSVTMRTDYSEPVEKLYAEFARMHFLRDSDLDPLYYAGTWQRLHRPSDEDWEREVLQLSYLPSWAPEYRNSKLTDSNVPPWLHTDFNASNWHMPRVQVDRTQPHKLWVKGFIFDTIVARTIDDIGEPFDFELVWTIVMGFKQMFDAKSLEKGQDRYPTGEDREMAFARTLLADGANKALHRHYDVHFRPTRDNLLELWNEYKRLSFSPHGEMYQHALFLRGFKERGQEAVLSHMYIGVSDEGAKMARYSDAIADVIRGNSFVITDRGGIGLVPPGTKNGDIIVIFDGARTPFVVRELGMQDERSVFRLIGTCYIHGAMKGETDFMDVEQTAWGAICLA